MADSMESMAARSLTTPSDNAPDRTVIMEAGRG